MHGTPHGALRGTKLATRGDGSVEGFPNFALVPPHTLFLFLPVCPSSSPLAGFTDPVFSRPTRFESPSFNFDLLPAPPLPPTCITPPGCSSPLLLFSSLSLRRVSCAPSDHWRPDNQASLPAGADPAPQGLIANPACFCPRLSSGRRTRPSSPSSMDSDLQHGESCWLDPRLCAVDDGQRNAHIYRG